MKNITDFMRKTACMKQHSQQTQPQILRSLGRIFVQTMPKFSLLQTNHYVLTVASAAVDLRAYHYRTTLVVGDETTDTTVRQYETLPSGGIHLFGLSPYPQHLSLALEDNQILWTAPELTLEVKPGEAINFNVNVGYSIPGRAEAPNVNRFAVLVFMDYQQIPINLTVD
jgi:hypothetical protein